MNRDKAFVREWIFHQLDGLPNLQARIEKDKHRGNYVEISYVYGAVRPVYLVDDDS